MKTPIIREYIRNITGTLLCACIVLAFGAYVPLTFISNENHIVINQLGEIRFLGPILIVIGIIGYLLCFWNFIVDAKGTPLPGDTQKHLIVKGLYRYVRNPMYISWYLILLGEALYFRSLDLLIYLFMWIVFFEFKVIFFEERYLKQSFGETYEQYCKSVRRWIPRLTPYRENSSESR